MSVVLGTVTVRGVDFQIQGERYMYPDLDETGQRVNPGWDYFDVYVRDEKLGCLDCLTGNDPFSNKPDEKELEKYLDSINFFTTLVP